MWVILLPWGVDEVAFQETFLEGVVPQKELLEVRQDQGLKYHNVESSGFFCHSDFT